jgi:hypothetical protein
MAKVKQNKQSLLEGIEEIQDALYAANTGLSRSFVKNNEKKIQISNAAVANVLQGFGYGIVGDNANSISELANIVQQTIISERRDTRTLLRPGESDDPTGIKMLTPMGNIDSAEQEIISTNAAMFQSFFTRTMEYRGVVELIPEVKRAIENIIRDIVNVSDLTNKAFNNVYENKYNIYTTEQDKSNDIRKNNLILDEIVEKNKLEVKFKRWLFESAVCGVKPVAFIPYSYIFNQLKNTAGKNKFEFKIEDYQDKIRNGESFKLFETKEKAENFYRSSVEHSLIDCVHNLDKVKSGESAPGITFTDLLKDILDDESVESYADVIEDDINRSVEMLNFENYTLNDSRKKQEFIGAESDAIKQIDDKLDLIDKLTGTYKDKQKKIKELNKEERVREARKGLTEFVEFIDDHVKVPKRDSSTIIFADKLLREKDRYESLYSLGRDYKMPENLKKEGYMDPNSIKEDTIGAFDIKSSLGKECLIVPYSPESVIPISINGEYAGFYCLEYEHIVGGQWKSRRKTGSFTDYIKQQGIGDDDALLGGGMSNYGVSDPLENTLYSPMSFYNFNASKYFNGSMDNINDDRRFDIMKTIILRVLSHRLHDPDLVDNKLFKDAVMHLLRNDILVKNKIQFTYIPPEYMCYITWKVDDDGVPISMLSGALYDAYQHISSKTASGMIKLLKSSDKEKYEVDVGLIKDIGYSVDELQRSLSTRTLYTQSMFSNLSTVIQNAGSYQRLIIPVVKGNKLYDVTQLEKINDLSPDDEFTNVELQRVLSIIYYNNGLFQELDNVDFAKQLFTKNLEYSNCIKEGQFNYNPFGTKMLRILTLHSSLSCYNSVAEDLKQNLKNKKTNNDNSVLYENIKEDIDHRNDIDIACINLELSMPAYLQMLNITDVIDTAKNMANSIAEAYGLTGGNNVDEAVMNTFKLKMIKNFTKSIDWTFIEKAYNDSVSESKAAAADKVKTNTIDEHIQSPQDSQTNIAGEVPEDNTDNSNDEGGMPTGGEGNDLEF